ILIDTRLQGGRGVEDANAASLRAVQRIHAEDDLFQRPRWHGADDDHVETGERFKHGADAGPQVAKVERVDRVSDLGGGASEIADVPAVAAREERDLHADDLLLAWPRRAAERAHVPNDCSNTGSLNWPNV